MDKIEQTEKDESLFGMAGFACLVCLAVVCLVARPAASPLNVWWAELLIYSGIPLFVAFSVVYYSSWHREYPKAKRIVSTLLSSCIVYGAALLTYGLLMGIILFLSVFQDRIFSMTPPNGGLYQHVGPVMPGGYQRAHIEPLHPTLRFVATVLIATGVGVLASSRMRMKTSPASRLSLVLLPFKSCTAVACLALLIWHTYSPHLADYINASTIIFIGYIISLGVLCVGIWMQKRSGARQACLATCGFAAADLAFILLLVFFARA